LQSWYTLYNKSAVDTGRQLDIQRSILLKRYRRAASRKTDIQKGRGTVAGVGEYKIIYWLVEGNARDILPG
jgi:hypothetical protein